MKRNLLLAKMAEKGFTRGRLAEMVGISPTSMGAKINGKQDFCIDEVVKICDVLAIESNEEKAKIFLS